MQSIRDFVSNKYTQLILGLGISYITYLKLIQGDYLQALISGLFAIGTLQTSFQKFIRSFRESKKVSRQ